MKLLVVCHTNTNTTLNKLMAQVVAFFARTKGQLAQVYIHLWELLPCHSPIYVTFTLLCFSIFLHWAVLSTQHPWVVLHYWRLTANAFLLCTNCFTILGVKFTILGLLVDRQLWLVILWLSPFMENLLASQTQTWAVSSCLGLCTKSRCVCHGCLILF